MKKLLFLIIFVITTNLFSQQIPDLPIPIGAGTAEVWNDSIYFFGGSDRWNGQSRYPRVYKYNGTNWNYLDSIPDNNVWGHCSVISGDDIYLMSGWPSGANLIRKYNLTQKSWTYLAPSPNTSTWGNTAEIYSDNIYLFNNAGSVNEYNISTDTWNTKSSANNFGYKGFSSVLYQDEIYILGFYNNDFMKYNPASDTWTYLADSPQQLVSCAMGVVNDKLYCIGGNLNGSPSTMYRTCIVYDFILDSWYQDSFELGQERHWMASVFYQTEMFVIGGFDTSSASVDDVEKIIPQGISGIKSNDITPIGFVLEQNYPNPFNPGTFIKYNLEKTTKVTIEIFDTRGQKIATIVDRNQSGGEHTIKWNAGNNSAGLYYYRLTTTDFSQTKKMILLR